MCPTPITPMVTTFYAEAIQRQLLEREGFLTQWLRNEAEKEATLTREFGPMHGPGRAEMWAVLNRQRRREQAKIWLRRAGGRPGQLRRA